MTTMIGVDVRSSLERRRRRRMREVGLVALGVVLHSVYMLSIFDIYFKSPIVHGMDPVSPRFSSPPPASRLVLLVADGLRADKFFEPDKEGQYRAPFLRSVIRSKGRWGVSHARPPTESRPGHVAIIAGFYEDPSAVTKGWKANPVEFDSVFNRSRHTLAFGSPDIVPIFCSALPHCTWNTYPHEYEDFASDASFLDLWSLDQLRNILNKSNEDLKLKELLLRDELIIFLHLLGCDTNGHAHRPYSPIYLNNIKVVDDIAKDVYALMEEYFQDNRTAYVFTADHGMSDKGSHGDGHPSNTDTPLVAWGAGIQGPKWLSESSHVDDGFRFVDEHSHDMPTPTNWGLERLERLDVNQADITPLMATIIGLPCPVNSVGSLPLRYVSLNKVDEVEASLANTKQILNQFLQKSKLKQSNSLHFKPFKPLVDSPSVLFQIEKLLASGKFDEAMKLSLDLRSLSLAGLHYFQTYDWLMLMTTITLGYIGWMICLALHVVKSYTTLVNIRYLSENNMANFRKTSQKVYLCGFLFALVLSVVLYLQHSPPMYYAYCATTALLWTLIFGDFYILRALWRRVSESRFDVLSKFLALSTLAVVISEFLVISFSNRHVYTWFFLIAGLVAAGFVYRNIPGRLSMPIFLCATCWFLSIFTMFPAEIPHNTPLVVVSGFIIILTGITARHFNLNIQDNKHWLCIVNYELKSSTSRKLFHFQVLLVVISSIMVWLSTSHRTEKQELLFVHQIINWFLAGFSVILPLFSQSGILARLLSIFLGFAPSFLILSIGYEALFYTALCLGLMAWILVECVIIYSVRTKQSISGDIYNRTIIGAQERDLQLADIRVPLIFMVFFNVAFFGMGNFASIASFEISSVYRFITIFSPFLMAALLIFKLLIPFFLVICAFSAITKLIQVPRVGCYFLVILFSDVMTVHFFFLVRNTGSWMEIGNSISHFGIMNAQVVFVLLLFALTKVYTRDIQEIKCTLKIFAFASRLDLTSTLFKISNCSRARLGVAMCV